MFCESCGHKIETSEKFCKNCGAEIPVGVVRRKSYKKYIIFGAFVALIITFALVGNSTEDFEEGPEEDTVSILNELDPSIEPVGYFDNMRLLNSESVSNKEWLGHIKYHENQDYQPPAESLERNKAFSTVVKIVCKDDDYFYYGSGTNVDPAGYILTNYHVIEGLVEDACLVGFPDPTTGLIAEAYWTTIITDKEDEVGHDLAYLAIKAPFFDNAGNVYGYYEKVNKALFSYFDYANECVNTGPMLGNKILVLGYPVLSGGALTITDGLISSLYSPSNYLITSAKIGSGNSGGLAMDENGCYVGVPTAVYYDENPNSELLGEIIDAEFVFEFDDAIADDLKEYYINSGIPFTDGY